MLIKRIKNWEVLVQYGDIGRSWIHILHGTWRLNLFIKSFFLKNWGTTEQFLHDQGKNGEKEQHKRLRHGNREKPHPWLSKLQWQRIVLRDWKHIPLSMSTEKKKHSLKEQLEYKRHYSRIPPNGKRAMETLSRSEGLKNNTLYSHSISKDQTKAESSKEWIWILSEPSI